MEKTDPIANALDITPISDTKKPVAVKEDPSTQLKNTEQDLEYARGNYLELIEKGRESLEDLSLIHI